MNNIVPNLKKGCEFVLNEISLEGTNLLKHIFVKSTTKTWYNPRLVQLFNPLLQDNMHHQYQWFIFSLSLLVQVLENAGERERISYFGQLITQKKPFFHAGPFQDSKIQHVYFKLFP